MPRPHTSCRLSPFKSANSTVLKYGDLFHPFASLKIFSQINAVAKLEPMDNPQLTPARPRPHKSARPSPFTSANLILFQYGGLFQPFASLKLLSHRVTAEKPPQFE